MPKSKPRKNRRQTRKYNPVASAAKEAEKNPSPTWYAATMFGLMGIGLILVLMNYILADTFSPWGLWGGLGAIAVGFFMTTNFR